MKQLRQQNLLNLRGFAENCERLTSNFLPKRLDSTGIKKKIL